MPEDGDGGLGVVLMWKEVEAVGQQCRDRCSKSSGLYLCFLFKLDIVDTSCNLPE